MIDLIIGDLHLRDGNKEHVNCLLNAIPTFCAEHGINRVYFLGDIYHQRAVVRVEQQRILIHGFEQIINSGIVINIVVGNHDQDAVDDCSKHSLDVFKLMFKDKINIFNEPTFCDGDLFLPYTNNYAEVESALKIHKPSRVFAHLPITGFHMTKTHVEDHGVPEVWFRDVEVVFAGHFHLPQTKGSIDYVGSVFINSFAESDVIPTVVVYDTKSKLISRFETRCLVPEAILFRTVDIHCVGDIEQLDDDFDHISAKFNLHGETMDDCKNLRSLIMHKLKDRKCTIQMSYTVAESKKQARLEAEDAMSLPDLFLLHVSKVYNGDETIKRMGMKYIEDSNVVISL